MRTNAQPTVVIVDDEEMVLTSLSAYLTLETEYCVATFSDTDDALSEIEDNQVDVVISDFLMPRMNGVQFLGRVKQAQPEASRILLTGHADKQNAIEVINTVGLFQYIEKPWDNSELLLVIRNGSERTRLLRRLRNTIEQFDEAHADIKVIQSELIKAFM